MRLVSILSVALLTSSALAQTPSPTPAPVPPSKPSPGAAAAAAGAPATHAVEAKPAAENDAMKYLVGKWVCDDLTSIATPGAAPVKVKTEYDFRPAVNKFWYYGTFTQKRQKDYRGFRGEALFGWVPAQKKYVFAGYDDQGGHVYAWAAPGTDKLTFEGDGHLGDRKVPFRYTWTKKSDKEAQLVVEVQPEAGKWLTTSDASCKRR